jgi:hypothetical protein
MRHILLCCLALVFFAAPHASAQGILPASVAGWDSKPSSATQDFPQIAGPAAPALQEYEAQSAETRTYTHGDSSFAVTVYTFKDTAGAYGAYSFLRTPDMAQANLTQHSCLSSSRALALTGNLILQFSGKDLRKDGDPIELLVAEAGGHAHWGAYPALPQRLPTDGFVPRSDHFVWGPVALSQFLPLAGGDWLGFSKGAEAELAHYRLNGRDATLVIVDYPTPQIATAQLDKLKSQFSVVTDDGAAASTNAQPSAPQLYARQDSTMLALVSGAPSAHAANSLLEQFHSGLVLMWNVPVIEKAQPSMITIVEGTFVGAGEICAFTLLGGVIFAGLRLLIKRLWPGRVFDRALDMEIIELGLGTRPIKGNDLYQMRRQT